MNKHGCLILGVIGGIALGFIFGRAYGIRTGREFAEINHQMLMGPKVAIVAATQDIPAGTTLEPRLLGRMTVFSSSVRKEIHPKDVSLILGRKVLFTIKAREPVTWLDIEGAK